jgi:hypothetical protein
MKLSTCFAITLGVVLLLAGNVSAQVVVTEMNSNSDATDDWFELTNVGLDSIDMTDWKFDDFPENVGNASPFVDGDLRGIVIGPGESVVVTEYDSDVGGTFANQIAAFRTVWGGLSGVQIGMHQGSGLGRDDGVSIFNPSDMLVAQQIYFDPTLDPAADNHAGEWVGATNIDSAVWDPTTAVDTSVPAMNTFIAPVLGVNGVITASDGGLGSPGAVPEPCSAALLLIGMCGLLRRR